MAEDLRALLEHLDLGPVFLAGHDFGAAVAYAYAAAYRDAVRKLAIMEMIMPGFGYEQAMQAPFAEDGLGRGVWHLSFHDAPDIPEALITGRERLYLELVPPELRLQPGGCPGRGSRRVRAQLRRARRAPRAELLPDPLHRRGA